MLLVHQAGSVKVGEIAEMKHFTSALLKMFAEDEKRKEAEADAATASVLANTNKKGGSKKARKQKAEAGEQ